MSKANSSIMREDMAARDLRETPEKNYYVFGADKKMAEITAEEKGKPVNRMYIWGRHFKEYLEENLIYQDATGNVGIEGNLDLRGEEVTFDFGGGYKISVAAIREGDRRAQVDFIRPVFEGEDTNSTEKGRQVTVHAEWDIFSKNRKNENGTVMFPKTREEMFSLLANDMMRSNIDRLLKLKSFETPVKENEITERNEGVHLYVDNQTVLGVTVQDALNINPLMKSKQEVLRPKLTDLHAKTKRRD